MQSLLNIFFHIFFCTNIFAINYILNLPISKRGSTYFVSIISSPYALKFFVCARIKVCIIRNKFWQIEVSKMSCSQIVKYPSLIKLGLLSTELRSVSGC